MAAPFPFHVRPRLRAPSLIYQPRTGAVIYRLPGSNLLFRGSASLSFVLCIPLSSRAAGFEPSCSVDPRPCAPRFRRVHALGPSGRSEGPSRGPRVVWSRRFWPFAPISRCRQGAVRCVAFRARLSCGLCVHLVSVRPPTRFWCVCAQQNLCKPGVEVHSAGASEPG